MATDIERKSHAVWHGSLKEGSGKISVGSEVLQDVPYTWATRFANDKGTNPEELVGAAHAACYAMSLSNLLSQKEYNVRQVKVEASVYLSSTAPRTITRIKLHVRGSIDNVDNATFQAEAEEAKRSCPMSKALSAVPIELEAILE